MDLESVQCVTERTPDSLVTQQSSESSIEQDTGYPVPTIDQSHDVALVTKLLNRTRDCHGVCSENILLWGLPGCGKRRIARQAALEFSRSANCKVLFIDGRTHETFLRDYRDAYITMTGDTLPQGLAVEALLLKIRIALESCRQDWLMVIFDLQFYLEDGNDHLPGGPDSAPTSFLPERSRIMVTSSYVVASLLGSVDQDVAMICGLKFARWATCLHVVGVDETKAIRYLQDSGVDASDISAIERHGRSSTFSIPPLRLALVSASMRLLGMNSSQFRRLLEKKSTRTPTPSWPGSSGIFSATMSVLWNAINDYEPLAGRILAIVSIVDRLHLPISLLAKFPEFQTLDEDDFSCAINTLVLSGLVEIHHKFGHRTINIPLTIYRWVQLRLRAVEDDDEYGGIMRAWEVIFTEYLTIPDMEHAPGASYFSTERFWPLIGHVTSLCNFKPANLRVVCSFSYMRFLEQVSLVLIEDGILFNQGLVAITHALDMCALLMSQLRSHSGNLRLHRYYVSMLQTRSLAFSKALKFVEAKAELREAERYLTHHLSTDSCYADQRRRIDDAKAHLSIIQQDFPEALRLLNPLISSSDELEDSFVAAQRHFWLTAYKISIKADVAALRHSHEAMKYWVALPEHERWGHKDSRRLHWVENHMICLMYQHKYKGALIFGRPLLKRAQELTPNFGISLCRMTYRVVICLCAIGKLDEAEEAVCHLIARSDYKRVEDETLSHLLVMLYALGQLLHKHGRVVEAEGVYRYILRSAKLWNVPDITGPTNRYNVKGAWSKLVICLIDQGKYLEAKAVRERYTEAEDEGSIGEQTSEIMNRLRMSYQDLVEVYSRRLEAERSGTLLEWEAIVDLYGLKGDLDDAITLFGDPTQRIEQDRDFESDIDIHNIRRARKSRILRLLNFPLVYQSFCHYNTRRPLLDHDYSSEELWCNLKQTILGQYWKFCDCTRKRRRSASFDLNVLVDRAFHEQHDESPRHADAGLKQRLIDGWVIRTPAPKQRPNGCSDFCPCIAANLVGEKETKLLESKLFTWKESETEGSSQSKPTPRHPYRRRKVKRQPIPDHEIFVYKDAANTFRWLQSEFRDGDGDDENYIIPNALNIPGISITPPDGESNLGQWSVDHQTKITEHYERDYAAEFALEMARAQKRRFECHRLDAILEDDDENED
ncbi:hypothetical protein LTR84_008894 [Exophiala bonariae]|uniref:AAA+ ATPase domain-containing protein n=1 Tax=Exophiala bonariae TaxID=1690606 RepID=A0AAV9MVU5_9EURO|nr:hypothetical protein LTR84_008894 [Exophiala bonariae]